MAQVEQQQTMPPTRSSSFRALAGAGSLGSVLRKKGSISNVLKTFGIAKPQHQMHVNVGKAESSGHIFNTATKFEEVDIVEEGGELRSPALSRTLGVSLIGACSSKGCPTKSVENEDRYVHGKINVDMRKLQGLVSPNQSKTRSRPGSNSGKTVPCWAFATFDGHAGPACAHFLKENFMTHLRKTVRVRCKAGEAAARAAAARETGDFKSHETDISSSNGNGDDRSPSAKGSDRSSVSEGHDDASHRTRNRHDKPSLTVEVVLARLLTDTLASLTKAFETDALDSGEISGACVIAGLYCQGALVLANVGDCQAVYHGQVKSSPGTAVTAQTTVHDATNPAEVNRFTMAGGFIGPSGRFQGVLEPSRTIGDVDVKADAPKNAIASFPELFKVDIASEVFRGEEKFSVPPFLVLATDGIWDETSANTVVNEVKDGIAKIQAHKRRYAVRKSKHRRELSFGSTTFTDGETDTEAESEFCGSGEWAEQGMDLAERVVSLARGRYDDATALVVVFE